MKSFKEYLDEASNDHNVGSYIPGVSKHKLGRLEKIAHIARRETMSSGNTPKVQRALHQLKSHGVNIQAGGLHPDAWADHPERGGSPSNLGGFGKDKLVADPSMTPVRRNTQKGFQRELSAERRRNQQ